jgi:hypothetical protein
VAVQVEDAYVQHADLVHFLYWLWCQYSVRAVVVQCQDSVSAVSGSVRTVSGSVSAVSGQCQDSVRTVSGQCQDSVRTVSGQCQGSVRTVSVKSQCQCQYLGGELGRAHLLNENSNYRKSKLAE